MKRFTPAVTLALLVATATGAHAQTWTRTAGPEGGTVRAIAATRNGLIAALAHDRVAMYPWNERQWKPLGSLDIYRLDAIGDKVIASTGTGLKRFDDATESWSPIGPSSAMIVAVNRGAIYAVDRQTLHRSLDTGRSWQQFADIGADVIALAFSDSAILVGVGNVPGVLRTTDDGNSWQIITTGLPRNTIPMHIYRQGTSFYAAMIQNSPFHNLGIYRSTDDGISWHEFNEGLPVASGNYPWTVRFFTEGISPAIATTRGVYTLEEDHWIGSLQTFLTDAKNAGGDTIYVGTTGGVMRSDDGGKSWSEMFQGMQADDINDIVADRGVVLAADNNGIHRTTDRGASWTRTFRYGTDDLLTSGASQIALVRFYPVADIYRSTDSGRTWEPGNFGMDRTMTVNTLAAGDGAAYAGLHRLAGVEGRVTWMAGGVYRSTDGGASWVPVNTGLPVQDTTIVPVSYLAANGATVIAATITGLYRSVDRGDHWEQVDAGFGTNLITAAASHDGKFFVAAEGRVYGSPDGATWEQVGTGEPFPVSIGGFHSLGGGLVARELNNTLDTRVYLLNGEEWSTINNRLPAGLIPWGMALEGDEIMLGTLGSGVWRGSLGVIASAGGRGESLPGMSIYPNPASTSAHLSFNLKNPRNVSVTLRDMLGRLVSEQQLGTLPTGEHGVDLDLESLAPGSYLYTLTAGDTPRQGVLVKAE